jgi:single-strand DNA-binding protein
MAQITGVFRIGKDAEVRESASGPVINLALASNYGKKGSDGSRPTQWIEASLWGNRAEKLEQYLTKGQQIYATINDPHIETYPKRDGGEGVKLVGMIGEIELVGSKPSGDRESRPAREDRPARREQKPAPKSNSFDDMDDDIPF